MISKLSKRISLFLCRKGVVKAEESEIYQYGFEIIVSTLIGFFIAVILGIAFHVAWLSIVYYLIFAVIRQFTGGYHADTYFRCNLTFTLVTSIVFGFTKMAYCSGTYTGITHFMILSIAVMIICRYAPVENENKPITEKQKKRNHLFGVAASFIVAVTSCFMYFVFKQLCILMAFSLLAIAALIAISKLKKGSEQNEKNREDAAQ